MKKTKDFSMLGSIVPKTKKTFELSSIGTLINNSKIPDCQFFKTYVGCKETHILVVTYSEGGGYVKELLLITVPKFLFPKEIERIIGANQDLIAFQWSASTKKRSPLYTKIVSRRKLRAAKNLNETIALITKITEVNGGDNDGEITKFYQECVVVSDILEAFQSQYTQDLQKKVVRVEM